MNSAECIVKRVDTTGFAHKEILEVDDHRLAVYTKADTKLVTRITGNSNTGGPGTETQALVNATGHLMVHSDSGFQMDAKTDAGVGKDLRCDDGGRLYAGMNAYTDIADDTTHKRVKCDANGKLEVVSSSGVSDLTARTTIGDSGTSTNLLCSATGDLSVSDVNITKGNAPTSAGAELQQVLIYGKNPDGTLQPLETLGDRLLVDVLELSPSGKISTSSALSSIQICGVREDTGNTFHTLKCSADGTLIASSTQLPTTLGQKANASSISTCRSTTAGAYDLSARTTIATASTSTKLLCDSNGVLSTSVAHNRAIQTITTDSSGGDLLSQIDGGEFTASITMDGYKHMFISLDSSETLKKIQLYGSHDDTNFFKMSIYIPDSSNGGWAIQLDNVAPKFVRIKNIDAGFISFNSINVFKTN